MWGQNLGSSSGFQSFLHYVEMEAPVVGQLFVNLSGDIEHFIIALAPIGAVVLGGLTALTGFVNVLEKFSSPLTTAVIGVGLLALAYAKIAPVVQSAQAAILAFPVTTEGVEGVAGGSESALAGLVASLGGIGPAALLAAPLIAGIGPGPLVER